MGRQLARTAWKNLKPSAGNDTGRRLRFVLIN
jgi:hypothetical protein